MTRKISPLYSVLLLLPFLLGSCDVKREDLSGVYTIKGLKNSIDTLQILPNGTYVRTLYTLIDRCLLFKNKDVWKADGDRILLYNYLPDEDEEHIPEEMLGSGAMLCDLPVKRQFSKIIIESAHLGDDAVYEKL